MGKRKTSGDDPRPTKSKRSSATDKSSSGSGRSYTVSIAVAASCIENAQNLELATLLAGQVARAAAIFNVDEVIVVDDNPNKIGGRISAAAALFARVLQFMETPQYLRKSLIPMHKDLKFAGALPPLDAPHQMRANEWGPYREGLVTRMEEGTGSYVDVGLDKEAFIEQEVDSGTRITVKLGPEPSEIIIKDHIFLQGELVSPGEPRESGLYWGYITRIAPTLQALFEECPFKGGYDYTVGTSERGEQVSSSELTLGDKNNSCDHLLIVFGGPEGLEVCLKNDPWSGKYKEATDMFDRWLNVCSTQGSRTIRTEEAILISMAFLQPAIDKLA